MCCKNLQVLVQFAMFVVPLVQLMANYFRFSGHRSPSKLIPCVKASRSKEYAPHATNLTKLVDDVQIDEGGVAFCYVKDLRRVASMRKNSVALASINAAPANLIETEGEHGIEVRWKAFQHCHCLSLSPFLAHGRERN